ncbi:MAG: hypothetical protein AAFQ02_10880, partial [Bacteroidota bacterium]
MISLTGASLYGQCTIEELFGDPIIIRSEDTVRVRLQISGTTPDTLGRTFQGICNVRLAFNHTNVSDLLITLVSPAGGQVALVGPAVGNGVTSSLLPVEHDITFQPAANPVTPDPGFDAIWSNINSGWGLAPPYMGSYYPNGGDLTSSYEGTSANGIWELIIVDGFVNDDGLLRSLEINLCDDGTTVCSPCESRTGTWSTDQVRYCTNDFIALDSMYLPDNFDTSVYRDDFIIFRGQMPTMVGADVDLSTLTDGSYTVFGLNTSNTDFDSLSQLLSSITKDEFIQMADAPGGIYCFDRSDSLVLDVVSPLVIPLDQEVICDGGIFVFGADTITTSGRYELTTADCDTTFQLDIQLGEVSLVLMDTMYLDCLTSSLRVDATLLNDTSQVSYQWIDDMGSQVNIGAEPTAVITMAGRYTVQASDGICTDQAEILVINPTDTISLNIQSTTTELNCQDTSALIWVETNYVRDTVLWTLNGQEIGRSDTIEVADAGIYRVEVIGENGCRLTEVIMISEDDRASTFSIRSDTITCAQTAVDLLLTVVGPPAIGIEWRDDEGNLLTRTSQVQLDEPGDYSVYVSNDNLCDTTISFSVGVDTTTLDITGLVDSLSLTCAAEELRYRGQVIGGGVFSSYWRSELGDTLSTSDELIVSSPGQYTFGAIGDNGCLSEEVISVLIDTVAPDLQLQGGVIDCNHPTIEVTAFSTSDHLLYVWEGVNIMSDNVARPNDSIKVATSDGTIRVTVLDTVTECFSTDTTTVLTDLSEPDIILSGPEEITCQNPSIIIENTSSSVVLGSWISPNFDTLSGQELTVTQPGIYTFIGEGMNGCSRSGTKQVTNNLGLPAIDLPDVIRFDCQTDSRSLTINDTMGIETIGWVLDGDTLLSNAISINQNQTLESFIVGANGCELEQQIDLQYDTISPVFGIALDTITCEDPEVVIAAMGTGSYVYNWTDTEGNGSTQDRLVVRVPGPISVEAIDTANNCTLELNATITADTLSPDITISTDGTVLTCDRPTSILNSVVTTDVDFIWQRDGLSVSTDATVSANTPGVYTSIVTSPNGCTNRDSIRLISDVDRPDVSLEETAVLTCAMLDMTLTPDGVLATDETEWQLDGIQISDSAMISVDAPGEYRLLVTGDNGCDTVLTTEVGIDTIAPRVAILTPSQTVCMMSELTVRGESDVDNAINQWTLNGQLLSESTTEVVLSESGSLSYRVTSPTNGCSSSASENYQITVQPLTDVIADLRNVTCLGDSNGALLNLSAVGGTGSTAFLSNGLPISANDLFDLDPGTYVVEVVDSLGCTFEKAFEIIEGEDYQISVQQEYRVDRGSDVIITPEYEGGVPISTEWIQTNTTIENIDSLSYRPIFSEEISVISQSANGCVDTTSTTVIVISDPSQIALYVPNVLLGSSEFGNAELVLQLTPDISSLDYFAMFDRWGEEILLVENVSTTQPIIAWDATYRNQELPSGVYTYTYQ